jgi:hypothetical protein
MLNERTLPVRKWGKYSIISVNTKQKVFLDISMQNYGGEDVSKLTIWNDSIRQ